MMLAQNVSLRFLSTSHPILAVAFLSDNIIRCLVCPLCFLRFPSCDMLPLSSLVAFAFA